MPDAELQYKWNERYRDADISEAKPAHVLTENQHLLPRKGEALDLACGLGGSALLLARRGMHTQAWDLSPAVIEKLSAYATENSLSLYATVHDVEQNPPAPNSFDVITVSYFLERALAPVLVDALKPGGLLFYQTFTRHKVSDRGPSNPDYRLAPNELLHMFSALQILVYREEDLIGDNACGLRDEALLVGVKL